MSLLDDFKQSCINLTIDVIVQKYLIENEAYFFKHIQIGKEFEFKKDIASILDVHIRDIAIVGSGKLGFSIKPNSGTPGLYLYKEFHDESDLDVAIISSSLFDKEMKNLYNHTSYYTIPWNTRNNLAKYILKGRLTTRFLPDDFQLTKNIKSIQEKYQMQYARPINIEIYKSWYYFETYHQENIRKIQLTLISST